MDLTKIVAKIKELGHVNKEEELHEYCSQNFDQILQHLPQWVVNSDGPDLLGCILKGMPDIASGSFKNKIKIIDIVLQTMRQKSTSLAHCADVVGRLCLELPRLPAEDLVLLCNSSVQSIVDDSDVNMVWRDIVPECMRSLAPHDTVKHRDAEMTSWEYKEQCVHTLCQCHWKESQLVQLAAMFIDMQLSKDSHKQVVNSICSYIIHIPPDTLPPLVHQLLKLCQLNNMEIVLTHLGYYFNTQLYSKLEPAPSDSESTTMDVDDISLHSPAELSLCLSTCLYHVSQGGAAPLLRKLLKTWPRTQLLKSPFVMDVALAISDKGRDFRSVCLDAIKSAIEQRVMDELKRRESAWARSVVPLDVDVGSLLVVLTTESANHRELTVLGLVRLAFSLLGVARVRAAAPRCWAHAELILVRLAKAQPETAAHILTQLGDRIAQDSTQKQYAECLYVLCKLASVSVERCTQLRTILENCRPTAAEYEPAAAVLAAVHPLLNYSIRTRDVLVMVCRKRLYSRESVNRCLALSGFLSVLRYMRVSRSAWSSQSSEQHSAPSYLTQLTIDMHATQQGNAVPSRVRNEAVCMEVVAILRRCLVQDAAVKHLLYSSIYECVKEKSVLYESLLELLYEHIFKYLPEDGAGAGPPLLLDKCVKLTGTTAELTEPIGSLLYAIAQFTQGCEGEEEDFLASQPGAAALNTKLNRLMGTLCDADFEIHLEDPGLSDLTPESKAKCLKVQQIVQCYEALIAYRIMHWNVDSADAAASVYKLFKSCNQLLEQAKAASKVGKKGSKTLNDTRETEKSQKEKGKAPAKLSNLVKDRAGPFKPLPCIWDLRFCVKIIELLYSEEIPWSSSEQRNQLIGHRDFHHWAVRGAQAALAEPPEPRRAAARVLAVAGVLYRRCVCRFEAMREFDETTALGCLELFKSCLAFLLSPAFALKLERFLQTIIGEADTPSCIAEVLGRVHAALLQAGGDAEPDATDRKIHAALSAIAAMLLEIPTEPTVEITNVIVKLEEYVRGSKQDSASLVGALLAASHWRQQEAPLLDQLLAKLSKALGRIDEDDTSAGAESPHFPYIDSSTAHAILSLICVHLCTRIKCAEHLLQRAKDLTVAASLAAGSHAHKIDKELKELYKSIVVHLCHLTMWTRRCAKLRCSIGSCSDRVLTCCVRLLAVLAALAKQMDPPTALMARFEQLLKLSGKKLSDVIDNLILYIEASQKSNSARQVLRDTKLIPRVVLESEKYYKNVIILSGKAKVEWQQYLSLGTARDFRIKASVLEQALHPRRRDDHTTDEDTEDDINDAATEILQVGSDREENQSDEERNTKRKRRRDS